MGIIVRGLQNTPRPRLNVHDVLSIAFYFMLGALRNLYFGCKRILNERKLSFSLSFSLSLVILFFHFFLLFLALISLCACWKRFRLNFGEGKTC